MGHIIVEITWGEYAQPAREQNKAVNGGGAIHCFAVSDLLCATVQR